MNWIVVTIFVIAAGFNVFCSLRFYNLYRLGVIPEGGRISLAKFNRALKQAKNETDRKKILQNRRWYILYLIWFYIALAGIIVSLFKSTGHI